MKLGGNAVFDYSNLKLLVEAKFGSMDEFAKSIGLPKNVLIDKFNGKGQFPVKKINKIAQALGINDAESLKACFFSHITS